MNAEKFWLHKIWPNIRFVFWNFLSGWKLFNTHLYKRSAKQAEIKIQPNSIRDHLNYLPALKCTLILCFSCYFKLFTLEYFSVFINFVSSQRHNINISNYAEQHQIISPCKQAVYKICRLCFKCVTSINYNENKQTPRLISLHLHYCKPIL